MARKSKKKEFNTGKSIAILFLYLFIWWIFLTLINMSLTIAENHILYLVLEFLRIAVPILVVLVGVPVILIIGSNKKMAGKKNK
mgnify:CR=1 FL=1